MNENIEIQEEISSNELDSILDNNESKKMKIAFKKYLIELVIFIFIGFLIGFFITELVFNNYYSYYEFDITTEAAPEYIFREEYFERRVELINDYNTYAKDYNSKNDKKLPTYSLTSSVDFSGIAKTTKTVKKNENVYTVKIESRFFKDTFVTSTQKLSTGLTKCKNNMEKILTVTIPAYGNNEAVEPIKVAIIDINSTELTNYHNPYLFGGLAALLMGLITISLFIITYKAKNKDYFLDISDNRNIYRTPFHISYWKNSVKCFKNVKDLTIIAVLFAMMLACKLIPIPSGFGTLGISFTYLFFSIIAMIYGPVVGLIIGIFSDVLGFFIAPSGGVFFPGYTLDAMIAGFTYGICFYKTKLTFTKCLLARLVVNLFVNVVCGSIWWSIINSFTYEAFQTYMLFISLPKNIIYLLPQTILLFIVLKAMTKPLSAFNLIDPRISEHVTIF